MRKPYFCLLFSPILLAAGCGSPERGSNIPPDPSASQVRLQVEQQNADSAAVPSGTSAIQSSSPSPQQLEEIHSWMSRVRQNVGWSVDSSSKANHGRVRICGVYWDPAFLIVAVPAQAYTVDGQPRIEQVYLQFAGSLMREWASVDGVDGTVVFWRYDGVTPDRFQFSFDLEGNEQPSAQDAWG